MTYIKITLPDKQTLKEELKKNPEKLNFYNKHDLFVGPTDSVNYLRKKLTKL